MPEDRGSRSRAPDGGLFHASFSLGRVAGVPIGVNWSWLLVLVLVTWSLAAAVFPEQNPGLSDVTYGVMAGIAAVLFFACLLLHELGHAAIARREGMEIDGITLWVFGGVARFKGMFPSAGAEFRIAIAGPLVSLALGTGLIAVSVAVPLPTAVDGVVSWLGRINLILLAFNMLPALPLDGGRVLRSVLWHRMGDFSRATRIAGALGRGFGHAMIAFGLVTFIVGAPGGLWFAFIGWFLAASAGAEARLAEARVMLEGLTVRDAMVPDPDTVAADASLEAFMTEVFAPSRHTAYPVTDGDAVVGTVIFRAVAAVPRTEWASRRVRDTMVPLSETLVLSPDQPLFEAAVELMQTAAARGVVISGGRLAGLLTLSDLSRLLELRRLTERTGPRRPVHA
jgi:Zn-dependent protease/CBS domain-containing protein